MAVSIPISMGYAQIADYRRCTDCMSVFPFDLCAVFYIPAVYFRRGCGSGGVDWIGVGRTEHHSGFDRSTGGSSDADLFRGLVAVDLFLIESRKTGQLYFCIGYWVDLLRVSARQLF